MVFFFIKTDWGFKTYVWDPNSDIKNENILTVFFVANLSKNTKIIFSSESVKTKEHKESNSCEKYYFLIDAFYKINFWPILKKLSQKIDFRHFPLFEIIAHKHVTPAIPARKSHISLGVLLFTSLDTCDIFQYFCLKFFFVCCTKKCGCDIFRYLEKTCDTCASL